MAGCSLNSAAKNSSLMLASQLTALRTLMGRWAWTIRSDSSLMVSL
jgi:hypothetical protein